MSYKCFLVESLFIENCTLSAQDDLLSIIGACKVYKIANSVSTIIYGIKRSIEAAKIPIDKHGGRWRKNQGPILTAHPTC